MSTASYEIPHHPPVAAAWRHWAALPVLLAGTAMVVLDFFIVNVAMPATQHDLHAGASAVQWVVAGYGLALAAGLITAGRLGDRFGRRRMFAWGLAAFTLTSAACGAAPTPETLIAARVAQGIASALLMPQVLAIMGVAYTGEDRIRAMTAYALTLGVAAVAGQLIGGALIQLDVAGLGWRSVFLVNVPVGIAALALTPALVPESRAPRAGRLDLAGAATVTAALTCVLLPLIEGREQGWPLWTWLCLAAAVLLLGDFALLQRRLARRGGSPLVAPALFAEPAFRRGLAAVVAFYGTVASFFLVLALYLQDDRGLSALDSGLVFSVLGAGFLATTLVSGRVAARLGGRTLALGAGIRAVALLGVWLAVREDAGLGWLALALLLDGAGMGLVMGPLIATVLARVPAEHAGAAAGVLSAAQQLGNALGVAAIGVAALGPGALGLAAASGGVAALFLRTGRSRHA